ncbi:hypothetical protein SODALDRAFT_307361 [Sodiomyces alkalinus F11]|uniref:Uncharacterized protein n=1 Tax=Sodiomyces alkalinus (strain CBS 110278 / VKM F-3762 / F11) TaxID=1314773 RepID=A0A3N2Q296_SODAK|nr:hypothetical protein SODALDRAFT_307361 [Sodiomyces alkalinus F11]ROT40884.1 hypothetical protein SODALDRAFT_307361 [Sodiomyces alkalinus F11]
MSISLEGLISYLIRDISCHGELGCSVSYVLTKVRSLSHDGQDPDKAVIITVEDVASGPEHSLCSAVWDWLRVRDDISVGPERRWNHLTLAEILALPENVSSSSAESATANPGPDLAFSSLPGHQGQHGNQSEGSDPSTPQETETPKRPRLYASEARMWDSIAGHPADFKRISKFEWAALVGIASTKHEGILQSDLCRLVGQDKRSLPKRTDALAQKGYILKRTTLVRGIKTSKLWLRRFAPKLPPDPTKVVDGEAVSTRLVFGPITHDMNPVSWCGRWTGKSIDTHAFARTSIEVIKEWKVIRYQDLRRKLGIEGLPWQMKYQAKLCRWMVRRGIVQFVAATLGDRLFKDCLKYVRDFTPEDWEIYLRTGKKTAQVMPGGEAPDPYQRQIAAMSRAGGTSSSNSGGRGKTRRGQGAIAPKDAWSPEKPLLVAMMDVIRGKGVKGVANRMISEGTIGPPFCRFTSAITTTLASPSLQPPHLAHFQVASRLERVEKAMIYFYSMPHLTKSGSILSIAAATDQAQPEQALATPAAGDDAISNDAGRNSEEHFRPLLQTELIEDALSLTAISLDAGIKRPREYTRREAHTIRIMKDAIARVDGAQGVVSDGNQEENEAQPAVTGDASEAQPLVVLERGEEQEERNHDKRRPKTLIVTFKINSARLSYILEPSRIPPSGNATAVDEANGPEVTAQERDETVGQQKNATVETPGSAPQNIDTEEVTVATENSQEASSPLPPIPAPARRGRPRKADSKGKAEAKASNKKGAKPGVFKCEKCGGVWKNDNGLKYHLEKSSSTCNSSYVPPPPKTSRRRRPSPSPPPPPPPPPPNASEMPLAELTPRRPVRAAAKRAALDTTEASVKTTKQLTRVPHSVHDAPLIARVTHRRYAEVTKAKTSSVIGKDGPGISDEPAKQEGPEPSLEIECSAGGLISSSTALAKDVLLGQRRPLLKSVRADLRGDISRDTDFTHRRHLTPNEADLTSVTGAPQPSTPVPKTTDSAWSFSQPEDLQPRPELYAEQPSYISVPGFEMSQPYEQMDTHGYRRNSQPHCVAEIVLYLIYANQGVFPGGRSIWVAILSIWETAFPDKPHPSYSSSQLVVSRLVERKQITRVTHAFRDSKGMFKYCYVLLTPGIDPLSPPAVAIKERIIAQYPQTYVPPGFVPLSGMPDGDNFYDDLDDKHARPGRQRTTRDIEVLDAPFYAKRRVAKRKPGVVGPEVMSPSKRPRQETPNTPREQDRRRDVFRVLVGEPKYGANQKPSLPRQETTNTFLKLTFLEPNQFLGDGGPEESSSEGEESDLGDGLQKNHNHEESQASSMPVFAAIHAIQGKSGRWPRPSLKFYERIESLTTKGWMPGPQWFLKSRLPKSLADIAPFRHRPVDGDLYAADVAFENQVKACRRWEHSPDTKRLIMLGTIAPEYFFINHEMQRPVEWQPQALEWHPENHLNLEDDTAERHRVPSVDKRRPGPKINRKPPKRRRLDSTGSQSPPPSDLVPQIDLTTRKLMSWKRSLPTEADVLLSDQVLDGEDDVLLLAAFVATRTLLGGADKYIEWGLLMKLFPQKSLAFLRKFWSKARKDRPASLRQITERFQRRFIPAYERGEIAPINFDDYEDYDWASLIRWTAALVDDTISLPPTREELIRYYSLDSTMADPNDWQEEYYSATSSLFSRLEALTSKPAVMCVDEPQKAGPECDDELVRAKSWVRALCYTPVGRADETRDKMAGVTDRGEEYNNSLLERAVAALQYQSIITRTKKSKSEHRPYRLTEVYLPRLLKMSNVQKFMEAANFKAKLDAKFRRNENVRIPYVLKDGEVMAMINLQAHGRVIITPVDVPHIPLGFKPGVYESRKFPKSFYNFGLEISPAATYLYDEDLAPLREAEVNHPPLKNRDGAIPIWCDFLEHMKWERWAQVLGAVTFAVAMRGPLDIGGAVFALRPYLEEFEVQMALDWGLQHEVFERTGSGSYTAAEWWWLVVGRQVEMARKGGISKEVDEQESEESELDDSEIESGGGE